jgi:hypothetical protein
MAAAISQPIAFRLIPPERAKIYTNPTAEVL